MIYLGSPYSSPDPNVREYRFMHTESFLARALRAGHPLISPVVMYHKVAKDYSLPGDFAFWKEINYNLLGACTALWVLELDGWRNSIGLSAEIEYAKHHDIPVVHYGQHTKFVGS